MKGEVKLIKNPVASYVVRNKRELVALVQDAALLKQKLDADKSFVFSVDEDGLSLLHLASAFNPNFKSVQLLLEYGLDPLLQCKIGRTALHYACRYGELEITQVLVKANPTSLVIKDSSMQTPLDLAKREKHQNVVEFLNDLKVMPDNTVNVDLAQELVKLQIGKDTRAVKEELDKVPQVDAQVKLLRDLDIQFWKRIFGYLLLPSQLNTLKLVSKGWKSIVESIPYLRLNDGLQRSPNRTVIAIAPVNSSGDIYHLLAFTILSLHTGYQVPRMLLSYDKTPNADINPVQSELNTADQVKRALNFVRLLGYGEWFRPLPIPFSSGQPVARQSNLVSVLKQKTVTHYIDNRITTSVISDYIRENGFETTTTVLRNGFDRWDMKYLGQLQQSQIEEYVRRQLSLVKALFETNHKPVVVFHYRYSDKANSDQDLSTLTPSITEALKLRFNLVGIYADSRRQGYSNLRNVQVNIRPFQETGVVYKEMDLGKLCHLKVLKGLYEIRESIQLKGIIGNTSGTLDLAAFLGHKVFNIHIFGIPFDYQDYRLMIQSTFLTIQDALEANIVDKLPNVLVHNALEWVNDGNQPQKGLPLVKPKKFTGIGKIGFSFLTSVCYFLNYDQWGSQGFIAGMNDYINGKLVTSGFLRESFDPSRNL